MVRYNFDEMGMFSSEAMKIVKNGIFIAHEGNFDLLAYKECVYSIPISGSGCNLSHFCLVKKLRSHLVNIKNICGYDSNIPKFWENVNYEYLKTLGID